MRKGLPRAILRLPTSNGDIWKTEFKTKVESYSSEREREREREVKRYCNSDQSFSKPLAAEIIIFIYSVFGFTFAELTLDRIDFVGIDLVRINFEIK